MDTSFVITFLTLFITLNILTKHALHKFRNLPPSPLPSLPIIGHLYLLTRNFYHTLSKFSLKHGPILFLQLGSRKIVIVSSPSLVEECLTKQDLVFANRPRTAETKVFGYNYTSIIWASYGDHWRNLRRIASLELLSTNRLRLLSTIRTEEVKALILMLCSEQNQVVNLRKAFFELTLNIMMRMIADKRYCGEKYADEEGKRFHELYDETREVAGAIYIEDYIPWISSKKSFNRLKSCQMKRDKFMQKLIDEQREEIRKEGYVSEHKKNLVKVLLSLQEMDPEYYTEDTIKSLMQDLLSAGVDTSSTTMEWGMYLLIKHPDVFQRAQLEIDGVVGHDRLVNETDLTNLPYLQCIINETLRMYPTVPLLVPHVSSEECYIGGYRIPQGTTLYMNMWAIQNDPKIWDNPREFKPERFEGLEGARDGFKFVPFGYGRRSCPGEALALRVVALTLASLIQCFEWDKIDHGMVDMAETGFKILPKAHPLKPICRPRPCMVNFLSSI